MNGLDSNRHKPIPIHQSQIVSYHILYKLKYKFDYFLCFRFHLKKKCKGKSDFHLSSASTSFMQSQHHSFCFSLRFLPHLTQFLLSDFSFIFISFNINLITTILSVYSNVVANLHIWDKVFSLFQKGFLHHLL